MNFSKKESIVYIDKNKLVFYGSNISSPLETVIPPDILNDIEIIDSTKLYAFIRSLIDERRINPANLIIILAPGVIFEQNLKDEPGPQIDQQFREFLENVPFENVTGKLFRSEKKLIAIATNKDICNLVKIAFENCGFIVLAVVPLSILQEVFLELTKPLDIHQLLDKFYSLKPYTLISNEELTSNSDKKKEQFQKNLRLYVLIGVFVSLILVLIVVIYINFFSAPPNNTKMTSNPIIQRKTIITSTPPTPIKTNDNINLTITGIQSGSPSPTIIHNQ